MYHIIFAFSKFINSLNCHFKSSICLENSAVLHALDIERSIKVPCKKTLIKCHMSKTCFIEFHVIMVIALITFSEPYPRRAFGKLSRRVYKRTAARNGFLCISL